MFRALGHYSAIAGVVVCLVTGTRADAQFAIGWHTIDGGGATYPGEGVGGNYAVAGTLGQPDASSFTAPMTGGGFEIVGGFWVVAAASCHCRGDLNTDGVISGADIQGFVLCIINGGSCACADSDGSNGVTLDDVDAFVSDLIESAVCP